MTSPNKAKGTYVLLLHNDRLQRLPIGRLGELTFLKGYYLYVGSALGPGGLQARIKHHLESSAKPHWHIDYFRRTTKLLEVWWAADLMRKETLWVRVLAQIDRYQSPHAGFGASDTRSHSHLFYSTSRPRFPEFVAALASMDSVPVYRMQCGE